MLRRSWTSFSSIFLASNWVPKALTAAITPVVSSPWAFSLPISLDLELRSLCKFSVSICSCLRDSSKLFSLATSSLKPFLINLSATS